jgi:hypothetical protein
MKVRQRLDDGYRYPGIPWSEADKRPGSRTTGWTQMRTMLKHAWPNIVERPDGTELYYPREKPGLFITKECDQFLRTVPVLPRDEKDMDDVNTEAEDHVADEVRYFIRSVGQSATSGANKGQ